MMLIAAPNVVAQKSAKLMRTPAMESAKSVQALAYILIQILMKHVKVPERVLCARVPVYASPVSNW
jgi:hypothetical protein